MSLLTSLPFIGKMFDDTVAIVKEAVVDKDKQIQIIGNLEEIQRQTQKEIYIKELDTKTIPWVDALHKLSRTILNLVTIIGVFILIAMGHEFTQYELLLIGGPNIVYQYVKGKGFTSNAR